MNDATGDAAALVALEGARVRGEVRVERSRTATHRVVRFRVGRLHGRDVRGNLWRLDKYLHAILPTIPRTVIRRWLERGCCTIDGRVAGDRDKLKPDQEVVLIAPLPELDEDAPTVALDILHRGRGWLAVNKPPGQLAHEAGRTMTGTLLNQLQQWAAEQGVATDQVRLVNRIDRDTSGIVIASIDLAAHQHLSEVMESRSLRKHYRAICHGVPHEPAGDWRFPIGDGPQTSIARVVRDDGQQAWTGWRVAQSCAGFALLDIDLHTGRQHQIRVHAAHAGHPLVGDWVYGTPCRELDGQALHSAALELDDPDSGRPLRIEAPFPQRLAALWTGLCAGTAPTPRAHSDEERSKLGLGEDRAAVRLPSWLTPEEYRELLQSGSD